MKNKNRELLIYIVIIVLQVLVILYWANVKVNYHIDELYSMGYASNFTHNGDIGQYITTSPDFKFGEWVSNSDLKKHLIVSETERASRLPAGTLLKKLITNRNYMILLNIAESIAGLSYVSSAPGLCLNLIFFVIAEVMLIRLMKKLDMDEKVRYLALFMFGFSGYMISAALYIRFYMLVIMIMLVILNCFYKLWISDNWKDIIFLEFAIVVLTYLSYKNSELTIPFFCSIMCGVIPALIITKKRKQLFVSLAVCMLGTIYVFTLTPIIEIMLHPETYENQMFVGVSASFAIHNSSISTITNYLIWVKELFEMLYFNSRTLLYVFLGVVTIALIATNNKENSNGIGDYFKRINPVVWLSFVIWIVILTISKEMGHGVFISLLVLFCIVVIGLLQAFGRKLQLQEIINSPEAIFVSVIAVEAVLYTIFDAVCEFAIWRYYCFGFVSVIIVLWFLIDRILKRDFLKKANPKLIVVITAFVILNALATFLTRNVENIYEDEKVFVNSVRANSELDVVLVTAYDEGVISRHDTYDCVNMIPETANVFITDIADYEYSKIDYPDDFMLWTHEGRDISPILNDLSRNGYNIEDLGSDHCSKAYICRH